MDPSLGEVEVKWEMEVTENAATMPGGDEEVDLGQPAWAWGT